MSSQRELGPEQRRHREEDGALEPFPVAKAGHDGSLPLTGTDAIDPNQPQASPGVWSGAVVNWRLGRLRTTLGAIHYASQNRVAAHEEPSSSYTMLVWPIAAAGNRQAGRSSLAAAT